ncbi:MAG: hypothetical protein K2M68_04090 [Muribaculaceae bacterium]|nr:hypothetical protein [Muribaculaceae bacterium]
MNTQIHTTDTVYATVRSGHETLVQLTLSGFGSIAELMKSICSRLHGVAGLVTVELRNSTLGWLDRRSLRLRAAAAPAQAPVQLTLF